VICIGANVAGANVSNSCYIGNIFNRSSPSGLEVFVNSDGKLGTTMSSSRFKEDIKPMDKASEAILALQPVTFRYKKDFDSIGTAQFGLVAEEVAKVNPDLVVRDKEGKPYSVRYDQVNAMLLNEFLKERKKVEDQQETVAQLKSDATKQETAAIELKSTVAQQQKAMEVLTAHLQEQAAQIQRMSAQLATVRPSRGGLELNKFAKGRRQFRNSCANSTVNRVFGRSATKTDQLTIASLVRSRPVRRSRFPIPLSGGQDHVTQRTDRD
jgi:hypothetical protein